MADEIVAARSERAVRRAASRLGVPIGRAQPLALVLAPDAGQALNAAAAARGMSTATLALRLLELTLRDRLVDAVLDDDAGGNLSRAETNFRAEPQPSNGNGNARGGPERGRGDAKIAALMAGGMERARGYARGSLGMIATVCPLSRALACGLCGAQTPAARTCQRCKPCSSKPGPPNS